MPPIFAPGVLVDAAIGAATRNAIVENTRTQLLNAGWTDVSGSSGDRRLDCVATADGNLKCRVRLQDHGGADAAISVTFMTTNEARTSLAYGLLTGTDFRILANRHQFFIFKNQSLNNRTFVCGGVPYLETFLRSAPTLISECIWANGNSEDYLNTNVRDSFRTVACIGFNSGWNTLNGTAYSNRFSQGTGSQRLIVSILSNENDSNISLCPTYWHNDQIVKIPARIAWGPTAITTLPVCVGQLWNAVVIQKNYPMDTERNFDGYRWVNVMHLNTTNTGYPSLWIAVETL